MQRRLRIRLLPDIAQQMRIETSLEVGAKVYNLILERLLREGSAERADKNGYSYLRRPDYCECEKQTARYEKKYPTVDPGLIHGAVRDAFISYQRYVWGFDENWRSTNGYFPFEDGPGGRRRYHICCENDDVVIGHGRVWIPMVGDVECLLWPQLPLKATEATVELATSEPAAFDLLAVCVDARECPWEKTALDPEDYLEELYLRRHRARCAAVTRRLTNGG